MRPSTPRSSPRFNDAASRRRQQAPLLDIRGLRTHFFTEAGIAKAVDGIDLSVYPDEVVGLVGESGPAKASRL